MRFPYSLVIDLLAYVARKRLSGAERFPLVLMLEPLHACNLACSGCGRIREYADRLHERLSPAQCIAAVDECGAPIVSICGGEPLLYPELPELIRQLLRRRKHVYLCTNGLLLEKMAPRLPSSPRLMLNVHLDGLAATHDALAGRANVFATAVRGIRAARSAGLSVSTNTTVYKHTEVAKIVAFFEYLARLGVNGMMLSPSYPYQAVQSRAPDTAAIIFLGREEIQAKFRQLRSALRGFKLLASPIYLEFLCGERELPCAAWANPTFNISGWRSPCYLVADAHYARFAEMMIATDWKHLGPGHDPRCAHCMVHYGFEPAAVLVTHWRLRDLWNMTRWYLT